MSVSGSRGGTLVLDLVDDDVDPAALAFGEVAPVAPVRLRIQSRRTVGDLVQGPLPFDVVSSRFVEVLESGGFTGWTTILVQVIGVLSEELSDHRGLVVTGRSGPIDRSRSERVVLPPHGPGLPPRARVRGLHPTRWDGSDVFVPEGTWHVCVSQAVRDAVVTAGLVGIAFTRLTEWTVLDTEAHPR